MTFRIRSLLTTAIISALSVRPNHLIERYANRGHRLVEKCIINTSMMMSEVLSEQSISHFYTRF